MPQFTFEGPDGKQHTVEGPEGGTKEQALQFLQSSMTPGLAKSGASGLIEGAGAPGDLSAKVLSGAPEQKPVDKETYYGKLVDALNTARKHLELPTTQDIGNAVGMQPTTPVTPAEKAVQYAGRAVPGMAMGGSPAGRAAMGAAPAANAVRGMGLAPSGPSSPVGGAPPLAGGAGGAGPAFQEKLLQEGLSGTGEKIGGTLGHMLGGPVGGAAGGAVGRAAGHYLPKMLRY